MGEKRSGRGEFDIPHGLSLDRQQNVYVADRENSRVQQFDSTGRYITQYAFNFAHICSAIFDTTGNNLFAVDDLAFLGIRHRGSNVYVFGTNGTPVTSFGRSGSYDGKTAWYHDITVDKHGNVYVADILGNTLQKFRKLE